MKRLYFFAILFSLSLVFTACNGDQTPSSDTTTTTTTTTPTATAPATNAVPPATGGVAGAVEHYVCPNGHAGSGAAQAGNCSQCNTALVHNQAFHANDPAPTTPTPSFNNDAVPPAAGSTVTTTPTTPAQNAAGVFHYTCAAGCAGGAAGAGTCSSCGGELAHNQAYHN